jgi:hypothetical protein
MDPMGNARRDSWNLMEFAERFRFSEAPHPIGKTLEQRQWIAVDFP